MQSRTPSAVDLAHFTARVIQDAMATGEGAYWRRRADAFEWAAPRPGDFTGRASPDELIAQASRLAATARACRSKARVIDGDRSGVPS